MYVINSKKILKLILIYPNRSASSMWSLVNPPSLSTHSVASPFIPLIGKAITFSWLATIFWPFTIQIRSKKVSKRNDLHTYTYLLQKKNVITITTINLYDVRMASFRFAHSWCRTTKRFAAHASAAFVYTPGVWFRDESPTCSK